jgi:VanZ family protein
MFVNSVIPIFSTKGIWRYADIFHFVEFFILGYLFINAIIDTKLDINKFLAGIFILTLIPMIDEGLQYYFLIPGRVADINDFIIDIAGEYVGAIFFVLIHKIRNKDG